MNLKLLLPAAGLLVATHIQAQQSNRAYAITGDGHHDFIWMNIREVDLGSGQVKKSIFDRNGSQFTVTDAATKTRIGDATQGTANMFTSRSFPTSGMVAAAALDPRSNKLFFIPMRMGELRWLNLDDKSGTPAFYSVKAPILQPVEIIDEANQVTRMVINADGFGYAVTNDGGHLYKFTTGKTPQITDLGALIDAEENKTISVHNKCSSWGGDMIADAYGRLYIISANHQVFMVDVNTRITTYKGAITGLPGNYTTNGAAVDVDGNIVVSSANVFEGYYKLTLQDLAATKIAGSDDVYNASDLANGNLLLQKEADAARRFNFATSATRVETVNASSRIFPNPVTTGEFGLQPGDMADGQYQVRLTDIAGKTIQSTSVSVTKGNQLVKVALRSKPAKGVYLVEVINSAKQIVFTDKLMVQ